MPDITRFLHTAKEAVAGKPVPVVDLIAVQSKDPYKVLVATILSARTKDEVTAKAAARLFAKAEGIIALDTLAVEEIEKLIYPVGFYKTKAKHLKKLRQALEHFQGEIPQTLEGLLTLPGVGRKTANLVLSVAFAKPAICVDTHVHRIMNIWEYVSTTTPLQTELALRRQLPEKHWIEVNSILVAFGQSICRPMGPRCDLCPLEPQCPQNGITPRKRPGAKMADNSPLKLLSWNVNGIRAIEKKGFIETLIDLDPDFIGLQETKAQPDQLSDALKNIPGYYSYWHSAEKKGYSGVACYTRREPMAVHYGIGEEEFDREGRVITLEYPSYYLVNIYFPNAGDGLKRLDFKLRFNDALLQFTRGLEQKKTVILCGDFNVAHKEIDLKNPKNNGKNPGFTPEERAWMDSFIAAGYIDTFRKYDQSAEQYSWWSYRFNARARNIGWRIDYFCVSGCGEKNLVNAAIRQEIMGSDHCPVELLYQP